MSRDVHWDNKVHPNIANSMRNLGNLYCVEGKHEGALKMHLKCAEIREAIYGKECEHPDIATSRSNMD